MECDAPHPDPARVSEGRPTSRRPRAVRRTAAALLLAAAPVIAPAEGRSGSASVQPYPSHWPPLAGMSSRCTELRGQYLDPFPVDRAGAPPRDGARYGAWAVFGIAMHTARADDPTVAIRQFTLDVRADGALSLRCVTDGAEVATRVFAAEDVRCGADGLSLIAYDRGYVLPPRYTDTSPEVVRSTLYRVGGHLYVRTDATTRKRWFRVVPVSWTVVHWQRFAVE